MRIGAVAVPLNVRLADDTLAFVLDDSDASLLVAGPGMTDRACALASRLPAIRHVVVSELRDGPASPACEAYETWLGGASPVLAPRSTRAEEVCMQPYTSGSTGKPKGVLLTHGGQIWNTRVMCEALMLDSTDRALVAVPLCHKNAMIGAVKPVLLAGGSLVILPGFDALAVIRAIERYRVTYLTGVPAMYTLILAERRALAEHDVSSVRYAVCGSADVPEDLADAFTAAFGAPLAESYGLTEGGPVPIGNARLGLRKRGSCGRALRDCEVRLLGPDGETEVGVNQVGELATRNPGLANGYWKRPDVTARKFRDGWLHTGDLFRRDADGYFFFVGRQDDMINVAGEHVYPKEVEDVLLDHPNVRDACVVAAPHELKGEVPVAFVVERETGMASEAAIRQFFLARGAAHAHPRRVYVLDALPLNAAGKPDRGALKRMARERAALAEDPRGTAD
jgi:long-chain acyl-CoA synthetase